MDLGTISLSLQYRMQHPLQFLSVAAFLVPVLYVIINEFVRSSARVAGIKGPRGLPLIGNLVQIRVNAAEQYRQWSKTYGPVYQIQLGNITVLVVNSAASAKVLFGQNPQALSSRPEFYTFHKVSETWWLMTCCSGVF
jgi:3-hydroxyphenylacetate 6-hydroxylase